MIVTAQGLNIQRAGDKPDNQADGQMAQWVGIVLDDNLEPRGGGGWAARGVRSQAWGGSVTGVWVGGSEAETRSFEPKVLWVSSSESSLLIWWYSQGLPGFALHFLVSVQVLLCQVHVYTVFTVTPRLLHSSVSSLTLDDFFPLLDNPLPAFTYNIYRAKSRI